MSRRESSSRALSAIALICSFLMLAGPTIAAVAPGTVANEHGRVLAHEVMDTSVSGPDAMRAPIGNDRYIILSTVDENDPYYDAVEALKNHRGAQVIQFDPLDPEAILPTLKEKDPRYVAVVIKPLEFHINFTREFLMMSTKMDDDPFSDFSYGFITGATAQDALNFVNTIIKAESEDVADLPLNISGFSASSMNLLINGPWTAYEYDLNANKISSIFAEENDSGEGLDFFLANDHLLLGNKVLDIGDNGDPHMTWLFDGGNFDPNPPVWAFDPAKVEDPAYARVGITSDNISAYDLYPAVVFNGACHSGELKTTLVESDIKATFGDTGGVRRFYTMSDGFSFALSILKTNITGYFAPVGANNANDQGEETYNAFLYDEPMGDIHKRTLDGVVMGFLGNRPALRIYEEGESMYLPEIGESGTFDPSEWPSAEAMLGGKANRVYFGDPMFDPLKNHHPAAIDYNTVTLAPVDDTQLWINISTEKPNGHNAAYWDKFHFSDTRIYVPVTLPAAYSQPLDLKLMSASGTIHQAIHAFETFDNRTIVHIEVDTPQDDMGAVSFDTSFILTTVAPKGHGVDILGQDLAGTVMPGKTTVYDVDVENTGDLVDDIQLLATPAPNGWGFAVDFNGVGMIPGETRSAQVRVKADNDWLAGAKSLLLLSAGVNGHPEVSDTLRITSTIGAVYGVELNGEKATGNAGPGMDVTYTIEVGNTGNAVDTVELATSSQTTQWPVELYFEGKSLPSGMTRNATIIVSVPSDALDTASSKFILTASSKGNISVSDAMVIETLVDPVYSIDIIEKDRTCTTKPGVSIEVPVTVQNLGNSVDELLLMSTAPPLDWTVQVLFDGTEVQPGATRDGLVRVTPPKSALARTMAGIIIKAMSSGNLSMTDEVKLDITVLEIAGVEVTTPVDQASFPGSMVRYVFKVSNMGNGEDSFTVSATSEKGWPVRVVGGPKTGLIGPGNVTEVTIETTIPKYAQGDIIDTLTMRISSTMDPSVRAEGKVWTTALILNGLTLKTDSNKASVRSNERATFNLTVSNTGNMQSSITLEVLTAQDSAGWASVSLNTLDMKAGGSMVVMLTVTPSRDARPGTYVFEVRGKSGTTTASVNITVEVLENTPVRPHTQVVSTYSLLAILIAIVVAAVLMIAFILHRRRKGRADQTELDAQAAQDVQPAHSTETTPIMFEEVYGPVEFSEVEEMELNQVSASGSQEGNRSLDGLGQSSDLDGGEFDG